MRASVSELGMLLLSLILGAVMFASVLFFAEGSMNSSFNSIMDTFWYSLVTMTTVGYGDVVPMTTPGKLIGCACAITGVLTLALSVPVIVANFEFYYKKELLNR